MLAAPVAAVALLALIDLVSGANAHLTRSVLDAGGLNDLADVAQRRLQLSAHSFARPIVFVFLPLIVVAVVARRCVGATGSRPGCAGRPGDAGRADRGRSPRPWSAPSPTTPAALLLEIGAAYLLVFVGFAWAEAGDPHPAVTLSRLVRIALVSPYSWTYQGGVNRHVEALAEEFLGRGHDVRVLAPFDPPGRLSRLTHRAAPRAARSCPTT